MIKRVLCALFAAVLLVIVIYAHPGRTDANGGHWDREAGEYHFHDGRYASKGSSNSSSNSIYVPFTPPYEPPTENPYRSDNTSSTVDKDVDGDEAKDPTASPKDILINCITFVICFFLSVYTVSAFFCKDEPNGCILMLGIYFGFPVLIALYISEPIISLQGTIVAIPFAAIYLFITILLYKVNKAIETYKTTLSDYEAAVNTLIGHLEALPLEVQIPSNYEIGEDNLPKERGSRGWGRAFTLYRSHSGKKLHSKKACGNATIKIHLYHVRNYAYIKDIFCANCCKNYTVPDLKWYEDYLKQQRTQNEYDAALNEVYSLKDKAFDCRKKFSPPLFKLVLQFSKKKRETVKQLHNQRDKIALRYLESKNKYRKINNAKS